MRIRRVTAVALVFASISLATGNPRNAWGQQSVVQALLSPKDLLIQSYVSGMQLTPEERAYQLVLLTEVALKLDSTLAQLWAEETFQSTLTLPRTHNRLAMQMNAIAALSQIAPERAFDLFSKMDSPVPDEKGLLDEDVRAHTARVLFPRLWQLKGRAVLDQLRFAAEQLGGTGQYPYEAFAPIVRDLSASDPAVAGSLVGEAATYYPRAASVRHNDYEFKQFLVTVWNEAPRSATVPALETLIGHLTEEIERPEKNQDAIYRAQAFAGQNVAQFQNEAAQFIYELVPLLRSVDPTKAKKAEELISAKVPSDQGTPGGSKQRFESVKIVGQPTDSQRTELVQQGMERSRLQAIESEASTDPNDALRLASTITNPVFRAEALFDIATALGETSPGRAKELISNAERIEGGIKEGSGRLRALTARAKALATLHRTSDFRDVFSEAFSLGEELFQEDVDANPPKPALFATGYDELDRLTDLGIRFQPELALARINGIQNSELKAMLLIPAADAMREAVENFHKEAPPH